MGLGSALARLRDSLLRRSTCGVDDGGGTGADGGTGGASRASGGGRRRRRAQRKAMSRRTSQRSVVSDTGTDYYSADEMSLPPASPRNSITGLRTLSAHRLSEVEESEYSSDGVVVERDGTVVLHPAGTNSKKRLVLAGRVQSGSSFPRKTPEQDSFEAKECYEQPDATTYNVRGKDYMKSRKKVPSESALMRTMDIDVFATEFKLYHIARHLELPTAPKISDEALARGFKPLLIINLQCPLYNPSPFGVHDGDGGSLIYYLVFPEGWHPDMVENKAALDLLEKFFNDGVCADGVPARDRLKLIPRITNVEEWYRVGPLSNTEYKLLVNYNDKPVLTRPQQRFYVGPNYLEVDLDVHSWNFVARRAFYGYIPKLAHVVFENALVIQGNQSAELPEQVLGCVRIFRVDFAQMKVSRRFPLREDVNVNPDGLRQKK